MKTKKSFKADLENKRALFALVGLVLALGFTYISFEWGKSDVQKNTDLVDFTKDDRDIENIEIPKTWQQPQREAAPVAKKVVTPKIVVVDKPETQDPKIEDLFVCDLPENPWITDSIDDGDDDPEVHSSLQLHRATQHQGRSSIDGDDVGRNGCALECSETNGEKQ